MKDLIKKLLSEGKSIEEIEMMLHIKIFASVDDSKLHEAVLNGNFTTKQLLID